MTRHHPPGTSVQQGDVIAGKYQVERVIGSGGMGVVLAAHHIQLDERVALKVLSTEAFSNANTEATARFLQEARAAVKIKNEHVARVFDVGQLDDRTPYIVMEYLEGIDLAMWLQRHGPLPIEQAVDFVLQACEAIADAHVIGIVHRDLKPANLFCTERSDGYPLIKVLDFGISKLMTADPTGPNITSTTAMIGTPRYMSPEQMETSKGVDARTDIWSLGIIVFQLLTGRLPFEAESITELAIKVATEPAASLRTLRSDIPPALDQAVAMCLEKERTQRHQTVGDLALALKDFGSRRSRASVERVLGTLMKAGLSDEVLPPSSNVAPTVRAPVPSAPPPETSQRTAASWGHTGSPTGPGRRTGPSNAVAAVVLATLGVTAAAILLKAHPVHRAPPSTSAPGNATANAKPSLPSAAIDQPNPSPSTEGASPPPPASPPEVVPPPSPASPRSAPSARRHGPSTHAAPPTTPDCDPNYYYGDGGIRIFKKECL